MDDDTAQGLLAYQCDLENLQREILENEVKQNLMDGDSNGVESEETRTATQ